MPKTLTYAMSYGFITGRRHSRDLRGLLEQNGYSETKDVARADIIIAHSAGCWLLPANISPKLMCFFAPALNPAILSSFRQANWLPMQIAIQQHDWAKVRNGSTRYLLYGATKAGRNLRIILRIKHAKLPDCTESRQVVFIANRDDPWPQTPKLAGYLQDKPWAFVSLSGGHEHIWQQPDVAAKLINYYAKRLLA